MSSPCESSHEVRVLLKQLEGEVQFLRRAPHIAQIANYANNGFSYVSREFFATPLGQNQFVQGVSSAVSGAVGLVGNYIRPRFDDMARHSAVQVYDEIFEYNEQGIQRRDCEDAPEFNEHRIVGMSVKNKEQFLKWILENKHLYTPETYRTSSHNCHHFVKAACDFLGVPIPSSVEIILNWLQNGGNSILDCAEKVVGKCVYSSSATSDAVGSLTPFVSSSFNPYPGAYTQIS